MSFKLPSVESRDGGKQPGHKFRHKQIAKNSPQKHDLDVVVDGAAVIEHHSQRATRP